MRPAELPASPASPSTFQTRDSRALSWLLLSRFGTTGRRRARAGPAHRSVTALTASTVTPRSASGRVHVVYTGNKPPPPPWPAGPSHPRVSAAASRQAPFSLLQPEQFLPNTSLTHLGSLKSHRCLPSCGLCSPPVTGLVSCTQNAAGGPGQAFPRWRSPALSPPPPSPE